MNAHPRLRVIVAPYDSGHAGFRMGAGPEHLLDNGLAEALRSNHRSLDFSIVRPESDRPAEVAAAFELDVLVAREVNEALSNAEFPLVLSGNCNTAVGAIAGASAEATTAANTDASRQDPSQQGAIQQGAVQQGAVQQAPGVVWFDGHADFQTPETTTTGFSDDQGLSIAVGHCWRSMSAGVPGFVPVAEEHVVLVGAREIESAEKSRLAASKVTLVDAALLKEEDGWDALAVALDELRDETGKVYVHLDLDVLDPVRVGRANEFASYGGPNAGELSAAIAMVRERFAILAADCASYDPAFDADKKVVSAAISCVTEIT